MNKVYRLFAIIIMAKLLVASSSAAAEMPSLNAFMQQLWQQSPVVQEADANVEAARAGQRAASKWLYNPEVELEAEDKDGEDKSKLVGLSQTIDWNGKFRASGKVAEFELNAAMAERDAVRQGLAVDVLSGLAEYQASKEILDMSVRRTDLMKRFSELAKNSFNAGDIDQSEYNLARLALSEALIQNAEAETNLATTQQGINSLAGFVAQKTENLPALPEDLPTIPSLGAGAEALVMKLPQIRKLQSERDAAQAGIKRARLDRFADPTISISGGKDEGTDVMGVSLSIPLNVFNTFKAEVDVAKSETLAKDKSLQNTLHTAKAGLIASHRNYSLSAAAWKSWQETGGKALVEQIAILDRKFEVGELSATDYLVQVQQTLDTEIAAIELHNKVWQAWVSWLAASGTTENWLGEIK